MVTRGSTERLPNKRSRDFYYSTEIRQSSLSTQHFDVQPLQNSASVPIGMDHLGLHRLLCSIYMGAIVSFLHTTENGMLLTTDTSGRSNTAHI